MRGLFAFYMLLGLLAATLAGCGSGAATAFPSKAELAPTVASEPARSTADPVSAPPPDHRPTTANTPSPFMDSGKPESTTPLGEDTSQDTSSSAPVGYEELLRAIPDIPETRHEVYIDDYVVARQLFDIPLPGPGDGDAALQELYDWGRSANEALGDTVPVAEFGSLAFFSPLNVINRGRTGRIQHLAFDIRSIDQTISAGTGPPGARLDVTLGRFDPKATDEALRSCSECPIPELEEYGASPITPRAKMG